MAYDGLITSFLGQGLLADRPAAPNLHPDAIGFYFATDGGLSVYAGGAWNNVTVGAGSLAWGSIGGTLTDQTDLATYIANAVAGLLDFKGNVDCSANPNYAAASKGDCYLVSVAGKIGGASGVSVDVGDVVVASADNAGGTQASVGTSWFVLEHNGVVGVVFATAAEIWTGTEAAKAIAPDKLHAAHVPQVLSDGATVTWDMAAGFNARLTPAGNRTLAVSNPKEGLTYVLELIQDATGSRTMTWPSSFNWGAAGAPTLSTAAGKVDIITLYCRDASTPKFRAVFNKDS